MKRENTYEKVTQARRDWYPVLQWLMKLVDGRFEGGREILSENPWPSLLWKLRCFESLMKATQSEHWRALQPGED